MQIFIFLRIDCRSVGVGLGESVTGLVRTKVCIYLLPIYCRFFGESVTRLGAVSLNILDNKIKLISPRFHRVTKH